MSEQCIEFPFSLAELGCSPQEWNALSLRLLPPRSTDFNEIVLAETLSGNHLSLSAAGLLFASEFERYMGRDSRILDRLKAAVEILPENIVTLRALVDELEGFNRMEEAIPYAERLAQTARALHAVDFGHEAEMWKLGKIRYMAGQKTQAIEYWRTLPFYQRPDGESQLNLYIEGCERRLAQLKK